MADEELPVLNPKLVEVWNEAGEQLTQWDNAHQIFDEADEIAAQVMALTMEHLVATMFIGPLFRTGLLSTLLGRAFLAGMKYQERGEKPTVIACDCEEGKHAKRARKADQN